MGKQTGIAWTDSTWSPWWGCTKVGPGCDNCYAAALDARFYGIGREGPHWGAGVPRRFFSQRHWNEPLRWNRLAEQKGRMHKVFPSMCDPFDNEVPQSERERFWQLIKSTPNLLWLIVTKRIGNARKMLPLDWGGGWPNVWLIATVVNQEEFDRDMPKLLATPAVLHGLSIEPMLGPIDMSIGIAARATIGWIICGGESRQGNALARGFDLEWAARLLGQSRIWRVPFYMKQCGSRAHYNGTPMNFADRAGANPAEWPELLRVREFPVIDAR